MVAVCTIFILYELLELVFCFSVPVIQLVFINVNTDWKTNKMPSENLYCSAKVCGQYVFLYWLILMLHNMLVWINMVIYVSITRTHHTLDYISFSVVFPSILEEMHVGPRPGSDETGETTPGVLVVTPLRLEDTERSSARVVPKLRLSGILVEYVRMNPLGPICRLIDAPS